MREATCRIIAYNILHVLVHIVPKTLLLTPCVYSTQEKKQNYKKIDMPCTKIDASPPSAIAEFRN